MFLAPVVMELVFTIDNKLTTHVRIPYRLKLLISVYHSCTHIFCSRKRQYAQQLAVVDKPSFSYFGNQGSQQNLVDDNDAQDYDELPPIVPPKSTGFSQ